MSRFSDGRPAPCGFERQKCSGKKVQKESQQLSQVESGGAQGGVDGVAGLALVVVAVHTVVGFEVADDGFDGRAAFQPFP